MIIFLQQFLFFKPFSLKSFIMAAIVPIFGATAASASPSKLLADHLKGLWSLDPIWPAVVWRERQSICWKGQSKSQSSNSEQIQVASTTRWKMPTNKSQSGLPFVLAKRDASVQNVCSLTSEDFILILCKKEFITIFLGNLWPVKEGSKGEQGKYWLPVT